MEHLDPLELDAARAGEVTPDHLSECAACRAAVDRLRAIAGNLRLRTAIAVPAALDVAILAKARRGRIVGPLRMAAAAILLVALFSGILGTRRSDIVDAYRVALAGGDAAPIVRVSVKTAMLAIFLGVHEPIRFRTVDVFVDSGAYPLAAWQVEITANAQVVGVEGGDAPYGLPAFYDPAALRGGRIVLAAYTTEVPLSGRLRVARLHMTEAGEPGYRIRLVAAAAPGGKRIEAKAEISGGSK